MKKIRRGNDFVFAWEIVRNGLPENLSSVLEKHLYLSVLGKRVELVEGIDYDITGNVVRIEVTPTIANTLGTYKAEFHYILPDNGLIDEDRKCAVDVDAFVIVGSTAQADEPSEFTVTSDMAIAFKGDKGDSSYQTWLDAGNTGTEADYLAWIQKPATDIEQIVSVNETARISAEETRQTNETARINAETLRNGAESTRKTNETSRVNAEGLRVTAETGRVNAEALRVEAETSRNTAEGERQTNTATAILQANAARDLANEKAGLAATATTEANTARDEANLAATAASTKAGEANTAATAANTAAGLADTARLAIQSDLALKADEADLVQLAGEVNQMINDESARLEQESIDRTFKTMRIGASGLVTLSPTTRYFTYRLNVMDNITLTIDLQRMIEQVGNARCRLIIDMPIVKTITITKPVLWGGTPPTFATAGQYVLEVIDVDGTNTPLIWQVASTTKVQATGNILFVDSTGADYSVGQINSGTPTRTTSSWAFPFKYLQNAINAATAGDIIFVKQGIYKPTHLRTTPTVYVDGDRLNRNATFTPKNGVDIYGGFVGTETKTWQRVMDANGYPVNKTILCGDLLGEAAVDPAKTVGDTRTDASKANAAYNVVFGKGISALTYLNGVNVRYGNASDASGGQSAGGGIYSSALLIGINNTAYGNTASSGGGWHEGTNTNCTAYSNTTATNGGGWIYGTNTNCTAYSNTASNGGGWYSGTNTNCTSYSNTSASGGGWLGGTNTNCTAYSNTTATSGGGWRYGTNTNCTAYGNTATNGGGWIYGTNTNCTAYSNTASNGGGWYSGTNTNCTGVNNKAQQAVFGATTTDTHINCLLYNNKTAAGVAVGFDDKTATGVKIFRNNAYDVAHPTITGGAGSDINMATCIANLTALQAKIDVPTFIGAAATPEQLAELKAYAATITTKLKPKAGSVLKGAGVNNTTYPNPTDYDGTERPEASTIGILEGE